MCLPSAFAGALVTLAVATTPAVAAAPAAQVQVTHQQLHDAARDRRIPVALYASAATARPRLALLSNGYGGQHTGYSFLAHALVAQGYTVASVQHELPGDAPLPAAGNPREVRRPSWEQGVASLRFVLRELQRRDPALDTKQLLLVGHSHGGDMSALYAQLHPAEVAHLVTLDNRRFPLPRTRRPRVLTLRSNDEPADPGVLPDAREQQAHGIREVRLAGTAHNDMWDGASEAQKREMLAPLHDFLKR